MPKFELRTPYGSRYIIHDDGNIERTDMKFTPSGRWKMIGLRRVTGGGLIPFADLTAERLQTMQWRYKNGNPRYTVVDMDHGTRREWGNTKYHGVAEMRAL